MSRFPASDEPGFADAPQFRPFHVTMRARRLKTPMLVAGKPVTIVQAPSILYVNDETGELLTSADERTDQRLWPAIHVGERLLQREYILKRLRPEVREFALFVLRFRNQRRGITPGIETLVKWYADLHGRQPCHVRRYVDTLRDVDILVGDSQVGPLFQFAGANATHRDHRCEGTLAGNRLFAERRRKWMNHPVP